MKYQILCYTNVKNYCTLHYVGTWLINLDFIFCIVMHKDIKTLRQTIIKSKLEYFVLKTNYEHPN